MSPGRYEYCDEGATGGGTAVSLSSPWAEASGMIASPTARSAGNSCRGFAKNGIQDAGTPRYYHNLTKDARYT